MPISPKKIPISFSVLAGGLAAALFWSPLAFTPFLQEDHGFLYEARQAAVANESWFGWTRHVGPGDFWRPLSVNFYWRFVAQVLGGNPVAAHVLNLLLLALAAGAVGILASSLISGDITEERRSLAASAAAFLFGIHGAQFLVMAWTCCAQEILAVLFSALTLLCWLKALALSRRNWAAWFAPFFFMCALLSKEGTIVLPILAIVLWQGFYASRSLPAQAKSIAALCIVVAIAWLGTRAQFVRTPPQDSPYHLRLGLNVFRNAAALGAFMVNTPRETFLFFAGPHRAAGAAWGVVCVAIQCAALIIIIKRQPATSLRRSLSWLAAFCFFALLPYLFLARNCYAYYALLALLPYAVLIARAATSWSSIAFPAALCLSSSLILLSGEIYAPYPAPIARARWGAAELRHIASMTELESFRNNGEKLYVDFDDRNRLAALGARHGIAEALGTNVQNVVLLEDEPEQIRNAPPPGTVLFISSLNPALR